MDVAGAPHRRQLGPVDVPARVDLEALVLEVAHLVGDGELGGHLEVAHQPRVDLGELGLLGAALDGDAEDEDHDNEDDSGSHE